MITYRRISTKDPQYILEKDLRNRVLRLPLGLGLSEQDMRGEDRQKHIVALNSKGEVIGCVLVAFQGQVARIRQFAVEESYRGRGIGRELMKRAEKEAREKSVEKIVLHARITARGYFEKLGYNAASGVFTEVTIPHIEMEKSGEF